jgi:anthranilate phosphoribosyltransferase
MKCREAIQHLIEHEDLSQEQAYQVASDIMAGNATPAQISAFLIALRMRGETIDEIIGFVQAMREVATPVICKRKDIIDTCGTGGDQLHTFNISTVSALVAAGSGCGVAKHGNRSVSSTCGSADVLEGLGVRIDLSPDRVARCIDRVGIGFLFAPLLHKAMKHAIKPRREVGVRTIFNVLGPLTNPAGTRRQLIGVFAPELTHPIACALGALGSEHAMVVHGLDGLDEITVTAPTRVSELQNGEVLDYTLCPEDYDMEYSALDKIQVKTVEESVTSVLGVLENKNGAKKDIVILNAGAAIYVSGRTATLRQGIRMARATIESGQARACLHALQKETSA